MIREIVASFCEIQTVNPERWKQIDEILQQALSQAATQVEAGEIIRSLIDRIELTPAGGTLAIKLYGDLAQIIAFSETSADKQNGPVSDEAGPVLSVVAGTRNRLCRTTLR